MTLLQDLKDSRSPARAFVAMGLFWGGFGAYVPEIKAQAALSDSAMGLALFCGALGGLCAMWLAPRVDRAAGQWAMLLSTLAMTLAFQLPGQAVGYWGMALAMVLCMGASGVLDVIMNARLSVIEGELGRSLMNLNHALFSFAYGAAALLAGGARLLGLSAAQSFGLCAVVVVLLALGLRHRGAAPEEEVGGLAGALPFGLVLLAGLVAMLGFFAEQATDNWSALHLERRFGGTGGESALGPAVLGGTMGIGRLWGQVVLAKMSEGRVLRLAAAVAAVGCALAAWAPVKELALLGFATLGLGVSVTGPTALAWIGKTVPPGLRALAISRVVFVAYAGFFMGPPALGLIAQYFGLAVAFSAVAVSLAVISLVLVPLMRLMAARQARGGS